MSLEQEDIIINDEEFVLTPPRESSFLSLEVTELPVQLPDDLREFFLELHMDPDDLTSFEYVEYAEEEMGFVEEIPEKSSPCTIDHLNTVLQNQAVLEWLCRFEGEEEPEDISCAFEPQRFELLRLQKHPELFPTEEAAQDFWHCINESLKLMSEMASVHRVSDTTHDRFSHEAEQHYFDEFLPYRDRSRKPWEQYLHNRAPGFVTDLSYLGSEGCIHVLPMSALKILLVMKHANASIIRGIEATRPDGAPYQMSGGDPTLLGARRISPEGHQRYHELTEDLLPPFVVGSVFKPRTSTGTNLETLNHDFGIFLSSRENRARPPLRFNTLCLIIHDKAVRSVA